MNLNSKKYSEELARLRRNSQRPAQRYYYKWLYSKIENELPKEGKILEIGSGYGMSEDFIESENIYRTEFMRNVPLGVHGGIDASNLLFDDHSFASTFAVDAIHHIPDSLMAIKELLRVTKIGGRVILVEPYVSLLSYPVYKIFHNEKTSMKLDISNHKSWVSEAPEDGNQGVMQNLLKVIAINNQQVEFHKLKVVYFSPLSFFATGGLSRPIPIPKAFIRAIISIEKYFPLAILRVIASRFIVIFEK
ncbi:Methyltransferase type 11 [Candidatus Nanopelagicaceae bacterium]